MGDMFHYRSPTGHWQRRKFLLSPLAAFLGAASASPAPTDDLSARIYVYVRRDTAAGHWLPVSCSGAVVADIKQGNFFALNVAPGRYVLSLEAGVPIVIQAVSTEASFIRLDWSYGIDRAPIPVFSKVPEKQARQEMRFLSYISPRQIHSTQVPSRDPDPPVEPHLHSRDD
jgi:hypothetical protein